MATIAERIESARERYSREHWVTLRNGLHIEIDGDGVVTKGPRSLRGTVFGKKSEKGKPFFTETEMSIPKEGAKQPVPVHAGYDKMAEKGHRANLQLQEFLDFGRGVGSQLGYETIEPGKYTAAELEERLEQPGGVVMLAPMKSKESSVHKVDTEYSGDWTRLLDIARASIAVDTVDEIHTVIAKMRDMGVEWAKAPKDRMTVPADETGYRDLLTVAKMPSGMLAEIQLHLKPILAAKAKGHQSYEVMREIDRTCKAEGKRPRTSEEQIKYGIALKESQRIYGEAWQKCLGHAPKWKREPGETEKQFAKRAAAGSPAPKELPEEYASYFDLSGSHKIVQLSQLRSTKTEEENKQGGGNAPKLMDLARQGVLSKRAPITVKRNNQGGYDVLDGNGTFTGAKAYGWKKMPVQIEGEA